MRALLLVALVGCASAPVPHGFHEVNDPSLRQVVAGTIIAVAGFALAAYEAPIGCFHTCTGSVAATRLSALMGLGGATVGVLGLAYWRIEPDLPASAPGSR